MIAEKSYLYFSICSTMGEAQFKTDTTYTAVDYLTIESESPEKWEFFDGAIRAMSGGARNHAVIVLNVGATLRQLLGNRLCTPFGSELKVYAASANAYMYPDAMVVCGGEQLQEGRNDVLLNPTMIVEVLSPTTMSYDFIEKFDRYKRIPSLKEYVLVSQDRPRVEVRSSTDGWGHIRTFEGLEASATLNSLSLQLPLSEVYQRVAFQ